MHSSSSTAWTGGCQCDHIRYRIDPAQILTLYCCHCTECQRQSASGFAMSMKMPRLAFELTAGELARWQRVADSGRVNRASFCPRCGCRIYHDGGGGSAIVSLEAGSLDDTSRLDPVGHIFTDSAQPWIAFAPGMLLFERQPPT